MSIREPSDCADLVRKQFAAEAKGKAFSPRQVSLAANTGENAFSKFQAGRSIRLETYFAFEAALGQGPGRIIRRAFSTETGGRPPAIEEYLAGLRAAKWQISENSPLIEFMDIYGKPTQSGYQVKPIRLGEHGLIARIFGTSNIEAILARISERNISYLHASAAMHRRAFNGQSILDERHADESFIDGGSVKASFIRSIQRIRYEGHVAIATYAISF